MRRATEDSLTVLPDPVAGLTRRMLPLRMTDAEAVAALAQTDLRSQ